MFAHLAGSRGPCRVRCWWLLAILLLFCAPSAQAQPPHIRSQCAAVSAAPQAVTALGWKDVYNPVAGFVGNRRRMLQTLIVLMCIGLYIMWWRK